MSPIPLNEIKFIEGATRKKVILNNIEYLLISIPRWMSHRMTFYRIMCEATDSPYKKIKKLSDNYHFIAVKHRSDAHQELEEKPDILLQLSTFIETNYKLNRVKL